MSNVISIEEWLKTAENAIKPKKDGEKLSAYDEQENRALYNQYVKEAELLNQRKEAEAKLQGQKESALRDNYVVRAQAQKKAEDALKFQGMTTGLSESSLIDLYAQGAAARASIINANDSAKNDIFSEYRQAIAESNAETNATIAGIDALRDENAKASAISAFTSALQKYEETDGDFEELKNAYEKFGASLDEAENYDLISKYQAEAKANEEATALEQIGVVFTGNSANDRSVSLDAATEDFFGYNQNQFNAMKAQLEQALTKGDVKEGEIIKINIRGQDKAKNIFLYKDGKFYKAANSFANIDKYDKTLEVYPNNSSGFLYENLTAEEKAEKTKEAWKRLFDELRDKYEKE